MPRMPKTVYALVSFYLLAVQISRADSGPDFPRLGGYEISSPQNYEDPYYQSQLARLNFVVINTWPGWRGYSGNGATLEQSVRSIKAINPNTRVFQYEILESIGAGQSAFQEVLDKINAMNWWAYKNGTSGDKVLSAWQGGNGPFYEVNLTDFVPVDAGGNRWTDWYAKWVVKTYVAPNPSLDGLYTDNVTGAKPMGATDGDWNRDGVADSSASAAVQQWYRQGYLRYFAKLKALMPGKLLLGNLANWGASNANLDTISGQLQGGVMEGILGVRWSTETWGGWKATLNQYRKTMAAVSAPKLVLFHEISSPTDYQTMRYGLATCLMDDGYYGFTSTALNSNGNYHEVVWFDEFDSNLGQETSSPPTAAWQNGVWRRDFQNGIALVNPKGNGPQTVTLEGDFKKIAGKQVPSVNNGQTVRTVTLQDRDGIVLLRMTAQKKPTAPPSVSIQ